MKQVSPGGLDVSRLGLGTMAMSGYYLDPTSSNAESIRTIQRADFADGHDTPGYREVAETTHPPGRSANPTV